jgi:hypothetical protein
MEGFNNLGNSFNVSHVNSIQKLVYMLIVKYRAYNFTDWDVNIANQALMTNVLLPSLEDLTPGGGAYLNEGDFHQPDFEDVFYGPNYDRLLEIKDKYDPDQIFYGLTAVGSTRWTVADDGRMCLSV